MKHSLKLGKVAGIGIFVHWTFLILIAWFLIADLMLGQSVTTVTERIGFVLAVFACIVLHELGHALTARRFNIRTYDITLLPIGGLARLEKIPEEPKKELLIAVAGPAVNVLIALSLFASTVLLTQSFSILPVHSALSTFATNLMWINVGLAAFNMLPAFPMDGGRILRALLASRMDYIGATQVAARVGQIMAALFGIAGILLFNPILVIVGLFVLLGAHQEAAHVRAHACFSTIPIREAMATRFATVHVNDTLAAVLDKSLKSTQLDFPVVNGRQVVGVLTGKRLIQSLHKAGPYTRVGDMMESDIKPIEADDRLEPALQRMYEHGRYMEPVTHDGELVGVLTLANVGELLMVDTR